MFCDRITHPTGSEVQLESACSSSEPTELKCASKTKLKWRRTEQLCAGLVLYWSVIASLES